MPEYREANVLNKAVNLLKIRARAFPIPCEAVNQLKRRSLFLWSRQVVDNNIDCGKLPYQIEPKQAAEGRF